MHNFLQNISFIFVNAGYAFIKIKNGIAKKRIKKRIVICQMRFFKNGIKVSDFTL